MCAESFTPRGNWCQFSHYESKISFSILTTRVPPSPLRASSTFGSLLSPLPNVNAFNPLSPRLVGAGAGMSPKPGAGFGGLLSPRPGGNGFGGMPVSPRIWGPEGMLSCGIVFRV